MQPDLTVTNFLLGIMAFVSLLQATAVVGAMVAGVLVYRRMMRVIAGIEARHVGPTVARVHDILDDVKGVTSAVRDETKRVERLLGWLFDAIGRRRRRPADDARTGATATH
jgi:hypothetical protein